MLSVRIGEPMKLSLIGQVVVGVSIAFGGIATPLIQNYQSQQAQNEISDQWLQLSLEQLSYYDGLQGRPAYIAYQNKIYDVTNASGWSQGSHEGMHLAGQDCTDILQSAPHGTSVLNQLLIIGDLVSSDFTSSLTSSLDGSTSTQPSSPETCTWIETDDARKFSRDDDEDDHDDEDDDDHDEDEEDDHDEDDDDDHDDDEEEIGRAWVLVLSKWIDLSRIEHPNHSDIITKHTFTQRKILFNLIRTSVLRWHQW